MQSNTLILHKSSLNDKGLAIDLFQQVLRVVKIAEFFLSPNLPSHLYMNSATNIKSDLLCNSSVPKPGISNCLLSDVNQVTLLFFLTINKFLL